MDQHRGKHYLRHSIVVCPNIKLKEPDEYGRTTMPNHRHGHVLKVFDYPSKITKKWSWYIDYWIAKMHIRFPHNQIQHWVCGYWPDDEADLETQKKRQISNADKNLKKKNSNFKNY